MDEQLGPPAAMRAGAACTPAAPPSVKQPVLQALNMPCMHPCCADEPGEQYLEWMRKGIHIITPNKKLNRCGCFYLQQISYVCTCMAANMQAQQFPGEFPLGPHLLVAFLLAAARCSATASRTSPLLKHISFPIDTAVICVFHLFLRAAARRSGA